MFKDLKNLTRFPYIDSLEVHQALYNKWVPKNMHFYYMTMTAKSYLHHQILTRVMGWSKLLQKREKNGTLSISQKL